MGWKPRRGAAERRRRGWVREGELERLGPGGAAGAGGQPRSWTGETPMPPAPAVTPETTPLERGCVPRAS